jgi:hypothetical protein
MTHSNAEAVPRGGCTYRCYFCHVTLVADVVRGNLVITAMPDDNQSVDREEGSTASLNVRRRPRRRSTA